MSSDMMLSVESLTDDLHNACLEENPSLPRIQALVASGAGLTGLAQLPDGDPRRGWTALMYAVLNPTTSLELIRFLVEGGSDVNAREARDGVSILHIAVQSLGNSQRKEKLEVVRYLVECSANVNATDRNGGSVLHYAVGNYGVDTCALLQLVQLLAGCCSASVSAVDNDGRSVFDVAVFRSNCSLEVVPLLISCSADVDESLSRHSGRDNGTPWLRRAIRDRTPLDVLQFLLRQQANWSVDFSDLHPPIVLRYGSVEDIPDYDPVVAETFYVVTTEINQQLMTWVKEVNSLLVEGAREQFLQQESEPQPQPQPQQRQQQQQQRPRAKATLVELCVWRAFDQLRKVIAAENGTTSTTTSPTTSSDLGLLSALDAVLWGTLTSARQVAVHPPPQPPASA